MPLQDIRVFHRENVGGRFPLTGSECHRRWISILCPRFRDRGNGAQTRERQRVHNHEHVVVGALRVVLASDRGAEEHDRTKPVAVGELELTDQFLEFHHSPSPYYRGRAPPCFVIRRSRPCLPARAATTAAKTAAASKTAEAATATAASAPTAA